MNKKKIVIILIIALLILFLLYLNIENTKLQVSNYDIYNTKIPNEFNDFKIIQISDFHNTKFNKLTDDLVKEIKVQKPDIIVITGDLVDSRKTNIDIAISFIKRIKDIAPIYFVTGNHEAKISEYATLKEKLENEDVIILDNKTKVLEINDAKINLIGINDPNVSYHPYASDNEKITSELIDANYNKTIYSILLSHRPELFDTYIDNELDLVLTGHAHGGQIRIPFIGGLISPNQGFFPKYTSGIFEEDNTSMIVSRGIGNSILPFRINNNPELVIVRLKAK